jgi:hypothetical protein
MSRNWFAVDRFSERMRKHTGVARCSFVICFAFQEFHQLQAWMYSEEKLRKNVEIVTALFERLISDHPATSFGVVSNREVDKDFVYMVEASLYLRDEGGFGDLISELRYYRDKHRRTVL